MILALDIACSESDTKARYSASLYGRGPEAEMAITKISEVLISVDRTFVPEALRGHGAAAALAKRVIADARAKGQRIVPICPFFKSYADKNREDLADVIQW